MLYGDDVPLVHAPTQLLEHISSSDYLMQMLKCQKLFCLLCLNQSQTKMERLRISDNKNATGHL